MAGGSIPLPVRGSNPRPLAKSIINNGLFMIKSLYLILSISLILVNISLAEDKKPTRWGYILHSSAFTDNYLETVIPHYTVICVTGFKISKTGAITIESTKTLKRLRVIADKHGVVIYPLISFRSATEGHRLLSSRTLREKTAGSIADFARVNSYTGIHLDLEYLPPEDSIKLGDFLAALRKSYRGKISMAVFPPVGFPKKWSGFHDLDIISPRVDEIVLMCYDYHGTHTGPGPVTDIRWAEDNITRALEHMKPSRIWLGIPAYGYRWCNGRVTPLSAIQGVRLAAKNSPVRDQSGTLRFTYNDAGRPCAVYISDKYTRLLLQKLAAKYGLAGMALWRIGFEE